MRTGVRVERLRGRALDRATPEEHARRAPREEALALRIDRHLELDLTRARGERDAIQADVRCAVEPHVLLERRERAGHRLERVHLARWPDATGCEERQVADVGAAVDDP